MARHNLGLLLLNDQQWAGGLYYTINLIHTFSYLDDIEKPKIYIFYNNSTAKDLALQIQYPYLELIPYNRKTLFGLMSKVLKKDIYLQKLCQKYRLSALYPYSFNLNISSSTRLVTWIPDFQYKAYPQYFSKEELSTREKYVNFCESNQSTLILSSQDAKSEFLKYYPQKNISIAVCPFVSHIQDHTIDQAELLFKKYDIQKPYYLISNQFHEHKNHLTVLKAIHLLKEKQTSFQFVFTGKYSINSPYTKNIKNFIKDHALDNDVRLLNFIPREHQLSLLKSSIALIQPSLYEGWNTSIEDAKTLNHPVIASDLKVHREQLEHHAQYFSPENHHELATLLTSPPLSPHFQSLVERAKLFSRQLSEVFFK